MVTDPRGRSPPAGSADVETAPGHRPGPDGTRVGRVVRHWEWASLLAMVAGYAVLLSYLSNLRAENLYTASWDLGINQQLLWTTAHGRLLYETADVSFFNAHSYLQVHSTYVAFAVAPLYAAAPNQLTLFVLQSTVFALSAVPLYYFARQVLPRPWQRLAMVALYLTSFAVISGLFYDFHWESFLPLEFLVFFLLVRRSRILLSLIPLALGTMTLEVFPFLAGGVLLFFLAERAEALRWDWRRSLYDPRIRALVGVAVLSLAAYVAVRGFQYVVVPGVLGVPSSTGGGPGGIGSTIGWSANLASLASSSTYWLLLLATFAFLPLLAPRYLILSIPWFVYSVFVAPGFSRNFGEAYPLVTVAPLALAAIAGLSSLRRSETTSRTPAMLLALLCGLMVGYTAIASISEGSAHILGDSPGLAYWVPLLLLFATAASLSVWRWRHPPVEADDDRMGSTVRGRHRTPRTVLVLLATMLVAVLVFDAVMSPLNSANFAATPSPGYLFKWGENPMSNEIGWLTGHIPPGATVLSANRLFPYVANDPNAWAVPWFVIGPKHPVPYFPFTPQNLPRFVLADSVEMGDMPSFLANNMFNRSVYGLVAYAYMESYPGTVYLFELGYTGAAQYRIVEAPANPAYFTWRNLTIGSAGTVAATPGSAFGRTIQSELARPLNGTEVDVWAGPGLPLLPGAYAITFNLSGSLFANSSPSVPLASVDVVWTGGTVHHALVNASVFGSELTAGAWTSLAYRVNLTEPLPLVEFRGFVDLYQGRPLGSFVLNYVEVERTGP